MYILAIESSCDETSAAVIHNSNVLSNIISSQLFHSKYGGVIPELASRAHIQLISKVVNDALISANVKIDQIDALAVTSKPGLIGSLIVGSNFAKGIALRYELPIVPINHIEGHIFSGSLQEKSLEFPYIALVVSGGHTLLFHVESFENYKILGSTVDDAAGEAFDKIASMFGLIYPGGPEIDKLSKLGNPKAYKFPRSMLRSGDYNFSFSGLKTSVRYFIANNFPDGIHENRLPDLCASVQQAIVDVLIHKSLKAAIEYNVKSIIIAGGVSANTQLRRELAAEGQKKGIRLVAPDFDYCMDNAAMIAFIAEKKILHYKSKKALFEKYGNLTFTVNPTALRAGREKNGE